MGYRIWKKFTNTPRFQPAICVLFNIICILYSMIFGPRKVIKDSSNESIHLNKF